MKVPLTKLQKELMTEFYSKPSQKVIYNKYERDCLWKLSKAKKEMDLAFLERNCPALAHQIRKSYISGKNIQSAVFSECVYAQTFANMLQLNVFINCTENPAFIPSNIMLLLKSYQLSPRYCYSDQNQSRMLIQAGGCNGIDSALITVIDLNIYTIEFKEPGAKTSEIDLPKYREDGNILITQSFIENNPQFEQMLNEQQNLNFFAKMGSNENKFSAESVNIAVTKNYTKKYADVVCTEDKNGYLVMMPVNQVSIWAKTEGEIRPAGRNHYKVWTPLALQKFISDLGGTVCSDRVTILKSKLTVRKERGGNGRISGYKINPLFFVYIENCTESNELITFDLRYVRQLNPTIAGKMFFHDLNYEQVKNYYCI